MLARTCEGGGEGKLSLVNVTPSGEVVRLAAVESPTGLEVVGADGEIWAVENSREYPSPPPSVDRIAPDGTVSHFSISSGERGEQTVVRGLAIGAEGALWAAVGEVSPIGGDPFETSYGGEIVRIAPDGSEATFQVPEGIEPLGIALGPDGNLWFTGVRGFSSGEHHYTPGFGYIGRVTPAGEISTYPTPSPHSGPSWDHGRAGRIALVRGVGGHDDRGRRQVRAAFRLALGRRGLRHRLRLRKAMLGWAPFAASCG